MSFSFLADKEVSVRSTFVDRGIENKEMPNVALVTHLHPLFYFLFSSHFSSALHRIKHPWFFLLPWHNVHIVAIWPSGVCETSDAMDNFLKCKPPPFPWIVHSPLLFVHVLWFFYDLPLKRESHESNECSDGYSTCLLGLKYTSTGPVRSENRANSKQMMSSYSGMPFNVAHTPPDGFFRKVQSKLQSVVLPQSWAIALVARSHSF